MKKLLAGFALSLLFFVPVFSAQAVHVSGYFRSNGTYVHSYERTAPDGNPYNNYSFPGNYNPNTGSITGGNPDTYLNNYYKDSAASAYTAPTYTPPVYTTQPAYVPMPNCPAHSQQSFTDSTKCSCLGGYEPNATKDSCVLTTSATVDDNSTSAALQAQVAALLAQVQLLQAQLAAHH